MNKMLYAHVDQISFTIMIPRSITGDEYNINTKVDSRIYALDSSSALFTFKEAKFCFSYILDSCTFAIPDSGNAFSYYENEYDLEDLLDEMSDKLEIEMEDAFSLVQISNWLKCMMAVSMV